MEWKAAGIKGKETVCAKVLSEDPQVCSHSIAVKRNISFFGAESCMVVI